MSQFVLTVNLAVQRAHQVSKAKIVFQNEATRKVRVAVFVKIATTLVGVVARDAHVCFSKLGRQDSSWPASSAYRSSLSCATLWALRAPLPYTSGVSHSPGRMSFPVRRTECVDIAIVVQRTPNIRMFPWFASSLPNLSEFVEGSSHRTLSRCISIVLEHVLNGTQLEHPCSDYSLC